MKAAPFIWLLLLLAYRSHGQDCTCVNKLQFVKSQIENNYAGFPDKVPPKDRKGYEALSDDFFLRAKEVKRPAVCFALIYEWLQFFRDGHVQVAGNPDNDDDTAVMRERIRNTEVIKLQPWKLAKLKKAKTVEGIYVSDDVTYTIAIMKSKRDYRDFAGVIVSSKTDMWQPGQVKLELKRTGRHNYSAITYFRDHSYRVRDYVFDGHGLNGEWTKTGKKGEVSAGGKMPFANVSSRTVDSNTLYIQVSTFDGSNAAAVDSIFKANEPLLKRMPNLIIDIRGNGGGSDYAFRAITPWLYTNPVKHIGVEVRATHDNIDSWRHTVLDNPTVPADTKEEVKALLVQMEQNIGKFVSTGADGITTMDRIEPYPKKVVVLMDEGCASSAEQFLLIARQSKKVTLMGTHSAGILDYANVRTSAPSPCRDIGLYFATTRSRRIDMGQGIDNRGIRPDIVLTKKKDWIAAAVAYMETKQ